MQLKSHSGIASKRKSQLSQDQQRLVELFQQINFGKLHHLQVQSGEPVFTPPPRLLRDVRIPGENGTRLEKQLKDFDLKRELIDFFDHLQELHNGVIELVEVVTVFPCDFLSNRPFNHNHFGLISSVVTVSQLGTGHKQEE